MGERVQAVDDLASFLARMEGAAEVSAAHVATATTISTGTMLDEEPGDVLPAKPAIAWVAPKARHKRTLPAISSVAAGLLLAAIYYGTPKSTDNAQAVLEKIVEAPPSVVTAVAVTPVAPSPPLTTPTTATIDAAPSPPAPLSPNAALFARRADRLLELGDISGARLLYERAAALGSGTAALSMARTFDPDFLAAWHASVPANPAKSAEWYRRALASGSTDAMAPLRRLESEPPR